MPATKTNSSSFYTFNVGLSKDYLTQYEFKLKGFLADNYWFKEEFIAGTRQCSP